MGSRRLSSLSIKGSGKNRQLLSLTASQAVLRTGDPEVYRGSTPPHSPDDLSATSSNLRYSEPHDQSASPGNMVNRQPQNPSRVENTTFIKYRLLGYQSRVRVVVRGDAGLVVRHSIPISKIWKLDPHSAHQQHRYSRKPYAGKVSEYRSAKGVRGLQKGPD